MERRSIVRAFDLFCGAGGSSTGARQAGVLPVGGVDLWDVATTTYQTNFADARTYCTDITQLSAAKVAKDVGPIDLLLASPECTHHSIARGNAPRDEESRRLGFEVIRFAKALRPRWVVVENVVQMETWDSFPEWRQELESLGYHLNVRKLNAQDFGVPQSRRRLYVLADREGVPADPPCAVQKAPTVESILRHVDENGEPWEFTPVDNGRRAQATLDRADRAIAAVGKKDPFLMVYYGSDAAGGFQTLDRPLRTITTLDRFALVQPNCQGHQMRMLQPCELSAAMGFPRGYKWPDTTRRNKIKLIGNAVCPPVMRAIVRSLTKGQVKPADPGESASNGKAHKNGKATNGFHSIGNMANGNMAKRGK